MTGQYSSFGGLSEEYWTPQEFKFIKHLQQQYSSGTTPLSSAPAPASSLDSLPYTSPTPNLPNYHAANEPTNINPTATAHHHTLKPTSPTPQPYSLPPSQPIRNFFPPHHPSRPTPRHHHHIAQTHGVHMHDVELGDTIFENHTTFLERTQAERAARDMLDPPAEVVQRIRANDDDHNTATTIASGVTCFFEPDPEILVVWKKVRAPGYDSGVHLDVVVVDEDGLMSGAFKDGDGAWRAEEGGLTEERAELEWAMIHRGGDW